MASGTTPEQIHTSDDSSVPSESETTNPTTRSSNRTSATNTEDNDSVEDITWRGRRLRTGFRKFAKWVFGPQGIASLRYVAVGDFSYGFESTSNTFVLCRESEGSRKYRFVDELDIYWKEFRDEYRDMLEACPIT